MSESLKVSDIVALNSVFFEGSLTQVCRAQIPGPLGGRQMLRATLQIVRIEIRLWGSRRPTCDTCMSGVFFGFGSGVGTGSCRGCHEPVTMPDSPSRCRHLLWPLVFPCHSGHLALLPVKVPGGEHLQCVIAAKGELWPQGFRSGQSWPTGRR